MRISAISSVSNQNSINQRRKTNFNAQLNVAREAIELIGRANSRFSNASELNNDVQRIIVNAAKKLLSMASDVHVNLIARDNGKLAIFTNPPLYNVARDSSGKLVKKNIFALQFPYSPSEFKYLESESENLVSAVEMAKCGSIPIVGGQVVCL